MSDKNIWFRKVLWSYIPISWKGWAFIFSVVFIAVPIVLILDRIADKSGNHNLDIVSAFLFVAAVAITWIVASRHSE